MLRIPFFRFTWALNPEDYTSQYAPEFDIDAVLDRNDTNYAKSALQILETHLLDAAIPVKEVYTT